MYRLSQTERYQQIGLTEYCTLKTVNTCLLIDIALTDDSHFNTKENEKLRKYKDLEMASAGCGECGKKLYQS